MKSLEKGDILVTQFAKDLNFEAKIVGVTENSFLMEINSPTAGKWNESWVMTHTIAGLRQGIYTIKPTKLILYTGCIGDKGHYTWESERNTIVNSHSLDISQNLFRALDGTFTPPYNWHQGVWMESCVGPWRIVSWWDRTIDGRPGSHSTFIGKIFKTGEDLLEEATKQFPSVINRFGKTLMKGPHEY